MAELVLDNELPALCPPLIFVDEEFSDCVVLVPRELASLRGLVDLSASAVLPPAPGERGKLSAILCSSLA